MDTIKDRFRLLLSNLNIGQGKFEEKCGMSNGTINNIKIGISSPNLEKIIKTYPEINLRWLISGTGDMFDNSSDTPQKSYTSGVPYFNVDFIAGFDIVLNDQTITPEYRIDFKKYNDADYWVNITGYSMEPLISNGDIIAIKEIHGWRDFLPFGDVYGIITNEFRTVKKITKSERGNDFLKLIPVNEAPEYQPQDIPIKIITHVFKVLGCAKKL
jgi:transcriptional regulator with XRE-family HTH domain